MSAAAFGLFTLALRIPSVVRHEIARRDISLRRGDPTARDAGRLSLNPLRHVDVSGSVLLAGPAPNLALAVLGGSLAWAAWLPGIDPVGAYLRHTVNSRLNLLVRR